MTTRLIVIAATLAATAWTQPKGPGNTYPTPPPMNTSRAPADPLAVAGTAANPRTQLILSGTILLEDGSPPPEPVRVEYFCGSSKRVETRSDNKGYFDFRVQLQTATNPQHSRQDEVVVEQLDGCQLRASLPGFTPYLANVSFNSLDRTDLGLIVLKHAGAKDGYTISLANANAPHDARLAYDQARKQLSKNNSKAARKELTKAVTIYPKYAAAWLELGRLQMDADDTAAARQSFQKALDADSNYLPPYERLAVLALNASQWQDLADTTERLIHLNAYEYPEAYYYNALANLGLQHLDDAAKSARLALEQDSKRFARAYYLLGMTLAKRGDFASAATQLKLYLASKPPPTDSDKIQRQLIAFEQQARQ